MVRVETIRAAVERARLFARQGEMLIDESKRDATYLIMGTKLSGSVRRLSMDLTRALAEMRKP